MVIKGFDDGVLGMEVGQKKTIEIPVDDAYGPRDPQAIIEFPIDRFPPNIKPEVGIHWHETWRGTTDTRRYRGCETRPGRAGCQSPLAGQDLIC